MDNNSRRLLRHLAYASCLYNTKTSELINITCKPSTISRSSFLSIKNIQTKLNLLYFRLSKDLIRYEFDDAMYKFMWELLKQKTDLNMQPINTFFIRSDYLLDKYTSHYKQVEVNMTSLSFVFHGPALNRAHSKIFPHTEISKCDINFIQYVRQLHMIYETKYKTHNTVMLMIDEDTTHESTNYMEKVQIIDALATHNISVICAKLNEVAVVDDKVFIYNSEVAVVYYRWFYNWDQFKELDKILYRQIELSRVVCIPSVEYQMINNKLFQVVLSDLNVLKRYTEDADEIIKYFGKFKMRSAAVNDKLNENEWLRKSIREGGNSVNTTDSSESCGVFYMKKIQAPTVSNSFLMNCNEIQMINEVSVFGSLICDEGTIVRNNEDGYLVRSKDENKIEGGVCSGNGGLDSIELVD